jgi:hypothetical protein
MWYGRVSSSLGVCVCVVVFVYVLGLCATDVLQWSDVSIRFVYLVSRVLDIVLHERSYRLWIGGNRPARVEPCGGHGMCCLHARMWAYSLLRGSHSMCSPVG